MTVLPGDSDLKPGAATRPFFGVEPALMDPKVRARIKEKKEEKEKEEWKNKVGKERDKGKSF